MVKGSTNQTELQRNYLLSYELDIPTLRDQQRMVDYLDVKLSEIDNQVSLLTCKRDAYLRLKKSIINNAVTKGLNPNVKLKYSGIDWIGRIPEHWELKRFKDFSELNPQYKGQILDKIVSFLPMEGLRYDRLDLQDIPFSEGKGKYTYFANGDLLVAKVTPCFENQNIAIASNLKENIGFGSSEIFVLRMKKNVDTRYIFYYSLTSSFQNEACSTMCGVGGLKRISPLFMRARRIYLPPLFEQQEIAKYLDNKCSKIDSIVANLEKQITRFADLKRSLIDEVITGKRVV
jgi:type I restriction enzyme S subunit